MQTIDLSRTEMIDEIGVLSHYLRTLVAPNRAAGIVAIETELLQQVVDQLDALAACPGYRTRQRRSASLGVSRAGRA